MKNLYLALSLAEGFGPAKKIELLEHFKNIEELFSISLSDVKINIPEKIKINFFDKRKELLSKAKTELEIADIHGIGICYLHSDDYPCNLNTIPDPPLVLYYRGSLSSEDFNSVAVVGCRDPIDYGARNSYQLGKDLAASGITVVSGLAKGIDAKAHEGALSIGGRTVAVLGNGLDIFYPKSNRDLQSEIVESGCLYSEYAIGTEPRSFHFPTRNRIISGLSVAVVVVEGSKDSGSLYTARFASETGREVYAFPGMVNHYNYTGTHDLIKSGAKLIESANDLITDLKYVLDLDLTQIKKQKKDKKNTQRDEQSSDNSNKTSEIINNDKSIEQLSHEEEYIINYLVSGDFIPIDLIIKDSSYRVEKVISSLTSLLLKGYIIQKGSYYARKVE